MESYLYAEQATLRKNAVQTQEAANVAAFLLSPRSSGINAQNIVVDAGMSVNYFDAELVLSMAQLLSRPYWSRSSSASRSLPASVS